jgi:GT2 family glycosyltransferase
MSALYVAMPLRTPEITADATCGLIDLAEWAMRAGITCRFEYRVGGPIHIARNLLLWQFLRTRHSHILWVDSDVRFAPYVVEKMLTRAADFVAALYWMRNARDEGDDRTEYRPAADGVDLTAPPVAGSVPVHGYVGFGCVLLTRAACERMVAAYSEGSYWDIDGAGPIAPVFDHIRDPETGLLWGEDASFCRRWRAIGGEIWAMLDCEVSHYCDHPRRTLVIRSQQPAGGPP